MSLVNKVTTTVKNVKSHWSTPPKGYFVNYKEIAAYSVGGIGVKFALHLASLISLAVDNTIVCHIIGIIPEHVAIMNIFATIIGFALTGFRAYAFDNIKSKDGKFRPFVKMLGIPTAVVSLLMVWMPYDKMEYGTKIVVVFLFYTAIQFFMPFYQEAYQNITRVISTNSQERTNILSISSLVWSLAPTICNAIVPIIGDHTGGMFDMRTYRLVFPPLVIAGVFLSYLAYSGTKERTVQSRSHTVGIGFIDAIRMVSKNKYFWIITLASWVGFLESAQASMLRWQFEYSQNSWAGNWTLYGLLTTILGNASFWGMLIAPVLVKKFGKRAVLIGINSLNIVLLSCLYNTFDNLGMMVTFIWLNSMVSSVTVVLTPAIDADIRDYQHYLSGQRIDGAFSLVGYVTTVVGMLTGLVLPQIYKSVGYYDDVTVLYDSTIRNNLLNVLVVASVIGAALNLIPYFFYDFTEVKQKGVVAVLKIRSVFDDYKHGVCDETEFEEHKQLIIDAFNAEGKEHQTVSKDDLKAARKKPKNLRKQAVRDEKMKIAAAKEENKQLDVYEFIRNELTMYHRPENEQALKTAEAMCNAGITRCLTRAFMQESGIKKLKKYVSRAEKYYPEGVKYFDASKIAKTEALPQETKEQLSYKKKQIRQVRREQSRFNSTARLYLDAEQLVYRAEMYDDILQQTVKNAQKTV
ncbi:MAG: MFS transporter [Clostridia bacterium]|nr:MFS transporter [Clostridia bacterium]